MTEETLYHDEAGNPVNEPDPAGIIEFVDTDEDTDVSVHSISFPPVDAPA